MKTTLRLLAFTFALTLHAKAQQPVPLRLTIPAPPTGVQTDAHLGKRVAVDAGYVVAGAQDDDTGGRDSGVVKVFDSKTGALLFVIVSPSTAGSANFGASVAISGSRLVVGAYYESTGATAAGSAYVFDLASATPTVPVFTLNNPSPAAFDYFGWSVAISGTRVVVGNYLDDTGA
jgi:FG-GAP repeat